MLLRVRKCVVIIFNEPFKLDPDQWWQWGRLSGNKTYRGSDSLLRRDLGVFGLVCLGMYFMACVYRLEIESLYEGALTENGVYWSSSRKACTGAMLICVCLVCW